MKIFFIVYFSHQHHRNKNKRGKGLKRLKSQRASPARGREANSAKKESLALSGTTSNPPLSETSNFPTWNLYEGILGTSNICQSLYESLLFDFMFHLFSLPLPDEWINGCRILLFKLLNHYLSFGTNFCFCVRFFKKAHHRDLLFIFSVAPSFSRHKRSEKKKKLNK